jgi:glycosyltransferase involved in cell wall biosynthesis
MKILFLVPYPPDSAPSQRFRFEQYLDILTNNGHVYELHSFWDLHRWQILYQPHKTSPKVIGLLKGFFSRIYSLRKVSSYDFIFIHREVCPLGPPVFEWLIAKVFKKQIIYDFDDAIWLKDDNSLEKHQVLSLLKFSSKVRQICSWSYKISCGNTFLANYAGNYNPSVRIIPTTIDTRQFHIPCHGKNDPIVIGWTGSHTTLPYLNSIVPVIQQLWEYHSFVFKIICNEEPEFRMPGLQFIKWTKKNEIAELNSIDIGIMPLPDTKWSQGKCGFKILQYMALEKAAVASNVGINSEIITHGKNGLLCASNIDWHDQLESLLSNASLRQELGKNGRITVEKNFSKSSNTEKYLELFS